MYFLAFLIFLCRTFYEKEIMQGDLHDAVPISKVNTHGQDYHVFTVFCFTSYTRIFYLVRVPSLLVIKCFVRT